MDLETFKCAVEAILISSDKPVSKARLQEIFGEEYPAEDRVSEILENLKARYADSSFGYELREAQGGYHFVTKPSTALWVQKFLATKPFRLGRSALETLAIVAYRQPITRAEIDQVRGIDSSHLLRTLIERGIVKMAGKADVPGRPVQYATTPKFLEVVGLNSLSDLPPLTELEELQGDTVDPMKTLEEGLERFIAETPDSQSTDYAQSDSQLEEIEGLIKTAKNTPEEIYESPIHVEIAEENKLAQDELQAFFKSTAKPQTIRYEQLMDGTPEQPTPDLSDTVN